MNDTVLIELRTEELPPKSLKLLSEAFADTVFSALAAQQFTADDSVCTPYATPRRLALTITDVAARQPDRVLERKGPAVASGVDGEGRPTRALEGFMRAAGVTFDQLHKTSDGKAEYFVARQAKAGEPLAAHLAEIVAQALKKLPIPKVMRWGDSEHQFVRPVHGLILLHGTSIVPGEVLGLASGRSTLGHRFLASGDIVVDNPAAYAPSLLAGKVIASFADRRAAIAEQLAAAAGKLGARINPADGLLDEVTALVEWPAVYVGGFEAEYLDVPQECLILTMQQNQKYFPLLDSAGKLLNKFLIVSNMQVDDPASIIQGNERVVRPRLADARFFYDQDRKNGFATRVVRLGSVVYHNKLGSLGDRAQRLGRVARSIAEKLHADANLAERAALFSKIDLLTDMVGEFPELQGIMGRYYLLHEGGLPVVADAIEQHYRPRFAGDALPAGNIACAAALADKLDALVGFFGIGQPPTGDKDPFGLRRAALGVLRTLLERQLPLDLQPLLEHAAEGFATLAQRASVVDSVREYMLERFRALYSDAGISVECFLAVQARGITRALDFDRRVRAVAAFAELPEAAALAIANKRVANILAKQGADGSTVLAQQLLREPAELELAQALERGMQDSAPMLENGDYAGVLRVLAQLRTPIDDFFEQVLVACEDDALRLNRLALLGQLRNAFLAVADISLLAVST